LYIHIYSIIEHIGDVSPKYHFLCTVSTMNTRTELNSLHRTWRLFTTLKKPHCYIVMQFTIVLYNICTKPLKRWPLRTILTY